MKRKQTTARESTGRRPAQLPADRSAFETGALRRWEAAAIATALLAFVLRLLFVLSLRDTPFFLEHFSDSRLYMQLASQIGAGGIDRVYFMSPLYPYLVALVNAITGFPELWMRILQALFGAAGTYFLYRIAVPLYGRPTGFVAAFTVAVYAPLVYYDGLLLTESLLTLLVIAFLFFLLRALRSGRSRDWALAGIVLGAAVVTRATVVLFLPAVIVAWLFRKGDAKPQPRAMLLFAASTLLVLLPTTIHNASTGGVFVPITSSFGYNLYAGNNASATGLYSMPENIDLASDPNGQAWVERTVGREMDATEVSAYWRDRALAWMGEHPGEAAELYLRKLLLFFHPGEIDQLGLSMRFYTRQFGSVIGLPADAYPLLLLLAAMGIAMTLRKRQGDWPLLLFLFVYVFVTAVFFVSGRMRLPITPLLILFAAHAVVLGVRRIRSGDVASLRLAPLGGIVAAGAILMLQPEVRQGYEQEYLKLGQSAFRKASYEEAERYFRTSLEEQETTDGLVNLGNALAAQQLPKDAAALYRQAIQKDSTYALAWFNFGNLRMQTGSPQYAYGYWKKAVECDPLLAGARRNLGLLLMQAGRLDEAEEQLQAYLRLETDPQQRAEIARDLERLQAQRRQPVP